MGKKMGDIRKKNKPRSMEEAARRAAQHIRNVGADKLKEPDGFASGGDMRKILEEKDDDDRDGCDGDKSKR
jgi:hypothetical protein